MRIDLTLCITPEMAKTVQENEKKALSGHLGTHFDVMNKNFPLTYCRRKAVVFDVSNVADRDIDVGDIALSQVEKDMFVAFYTGFIEKVGYGTPLYFHQHPQLSDALIDALLEKDISIIGVDFAGVRRGREHTPKDQYCADHGVFIVENLCGLRTVVGECTMHIDLMNDAETTGLPCSVIAETGAPPADGSIRREEGS